LLSLLLEVTSTVVMTMIATRSKQQSIHDMRMKPFRLRRRC
jgi:hypothetical protein